MTFPARPPEATISVEPEQRLDGPGMHVCMFVYNSCNTDARVLKEAASLTAAGHRVQIVAVLDKRSASIEEREGFRIVRIDRQPVHYWLLRRARRVRRWLRLRRAITLRGWARWRRTLRSTARAVPGRAVAALRRPRRRAVGEERPVPTMALPLVLVWRAVRWRVLRRVPVLRRMYYRRRAKRARRRKLADLMVDREAPAPPAPRPPPVPLVPLAAMSTARAAVEIRRPAPDPPSARFVGPARALSGGFARVDRSASHVAYRGVMTFHKPLLYLDYYRRAYTAAVNEPFDVYHAHDLNTLPVAAAAARSTGRPLVYDSHELYPDVSGLSRKERAIWRRVEPRLIRRASRVITVCESIAGELVDRYGIGEPDVLLNCPPAATIPEANQVNVLRAKAGLEDNDEPIVLYQGGFAPGRGIDALIDAAAHLRRGVVVLMGWGAIEDELAHRIRERNLEDKVRMIPPATRAELLQYTAGADVGVIPYQPVGLNNLYTTPNKLFEYIAANVPVAGSAVPELKRFIEGYALGATFDPYDPQDIARTIDGLLADPERLHQMRASAKAAAGVLNWEREQDKLLRIYEELGALAVPARQR